MLYWGTTITRHWIIKKVTMISRYIYLEFLQLVKDYFATLRKNEFLFEWGIPMVVSVIFYFSKTNLQGFSIIINVLAILIGFSITTIAILSSSKNMNKLKEILSERKIGGQRITLYQLMMITFSFMLFIEIFLLFYNLILKFFTISIHFRILYSLNIFFITQILLLNLRNMTNIYFISFRNWG